VVCQFNCLAPLWESIPASNFTPISDPEIAILFNNDHLLPGIGHLIHSFHWQPFEFALESHDSQGIQNFILPTLHE